jgi:hypothetical protein
MIRFYAKCTLIQRRLTFVVSLCQICCEFMQFATDLAYSESYPDWDCLEVYFSWQRFEYKRANPLRMPCGASSARCRLKT